MSGITAELRAENDAVSIPFAAVRRPDVRVRTASVATTPDIVVVEFIDPTAVRPGFDELGQLVDNGELRLLDLEFIHSIDGVASTVPAGRVDKDFDRFEHDLAGLLDRLELDAVAADLPHRTTAAALLAEGDSLDQVIAAWESGGARVSRRSSAA